MPSDTLLRRGSGLPRLWFLYLRVKPSRMKHCMYALMFAVAVCVSGCRDKAIEGQAPPPPAVAPELSICKGAPATFGIEDVDEVLKPVVDSVCVDPNTPPRMYGEKAPHSMDMVCTELFNGECELYKSFGLRRVTTLRYVRSDGSLASVSAVVSRFVGPEGALSFFSRRVLSNQDPKVVTLEPIEPVEGSALGTGVAYFWVGPFVVELTYTNEQETPTEVRASSRELLSRIVRAGGTGNTAKGLPATALVLPTSGRLRFGVSFEPKDGFGVSGLGPVATGYYEQHGKRYRVAVSQSENEAQAKDVYNGLHRLPGRHSLKDVAYDAFEVRDAVPGRAPTMWLVGKLDGRVAAIMDEPLVLEGLTQQQQDALSLDRAAKMELLKGVLTAR